MAAVGSFLAARSRGDRWLVRMEDLDSSRVLPGCAPQMLRTLEAFGLHWDGAVEYQSQRTAHYEEALERLRARGLTFECSCSRADRLAEGGYPGTCRQGARRPGPTATRFRVDDVTISFEDALQGSCHFALRERGDVIVRRRDGAFAYQLAVVVDDALQGVTDVVRGADLLDSTPWQIALQHSLGLSTPCYAHLPLVTEPDGRKLAKSRRAIGLDSRHPGAPLVRALALLGQHPPMELGRQSSENILAWAIPRWDPKLLCGLREIPAAQATDIFR